MISSDAYLVQVKCTIKSTAYNSQIWSSDEWAKQICVIDLFLSLFFPFPVAVLSVRAACDLLEELMETVAQTRALGRMILHQLIQPNLSR